MEDCSNDLGRRYKAEMLSAALVYLAATYASVRWLHHHPPAPWKYGIAVLPMVPMLFVLVVVLRYFRGIDELQRKIQLEALAFAFTVTVGLTLSYGFLQNAGLPQLSCIWVGAAMGLLWAVGEALARRRYR